MAQAVKTYRFLPVITGLFVAALLVSETLAGKIIGYGPFNLSVAIVVFPLSYLINDVLTEVYGYRASRRVIWTGFAALALMVGCYEIALAIPGASFWQQQQAYETVLGNVPRVVLGSAVAYFMGEFCNSYILAKLKVRTQGRTMGGRFVLSTVVGEFVDSIVFFPIAFLGILPQGVLLSMILCEWAAKVLWEIVALPATLPFTRWLKKIESEDHYDRDTNFNPFSYE